MNTPLAIFAVLVLLIIASTFLWRFITQDLNRPISTQGKRFKISSPPGKWFSYLEGAALLEMPVEQARLFYKDNSPQPQIGTFSFNCGHVTICDPFNRIYVAVVSKTIMRIMGREGYTPRNWVQPLCGKNNPKCARPQKINGHEYIEYPYFLGSIAENPGQWNTYHEMRIEFQQNPINDDEAWSSYEEGVKEFLEREF